MTHLAAHVPNRVSAVRYHPQERTRLRSLDSYAIMDTGEDPTFDVLVRSAAALLGSSVAALTFIHYERQWVKAAHGTSLREGSRELALCSDVVAADAPMTVDDLSQHPRYARNPNLVAAGLRSYAGVPLVGRDGLPLGALCVLDRAPQRFADSDLRVLQALAAAAVALLEQRRDEIEAGPAPLPTATTVPFVTAHRLRAAVENGEFEVHYQPIVTIADGQVVAAEALLRWNAPGIGEVGPAAFVPSLLRSPLLSQLITEFALRDACHQAARWRARGTGEFGVSVNVTGSDVCGGTLFDVVTAALADSGLAPSALTLEITETIGLSDRVVAVDHLSRLRTLGVRISLDDFGVGYSGLELLGLLPITGLKIDRGFVAALEDSPAMRVALDGVVSIAARLDLDLVGEGVETREQALALARAGVGRAQGYYFARPAAAGRMSRLLSANRARADASPPRLG